MTITVTTAIGREHLKTVPLYKLPAELAIVGITYLRCVVEQGVLPSMPSTVELSVAADAHEAGTETADGP